MIQEILALSRLKKQIILFFLDFLLSNLAFLISIIVLEGRIKINIFEYDYLFLIITFTFFPFFLFFGLYSRILRYIELDIIYNVIKAIFLYFCFLGIFILVSKSNYFLFLLFLFYIAIFSIMISSSRLILSKILSKNTNQFSKNVLIYGADQYTLNNMNFLKRYKIVCFVDDNPLIVNRYIGNFKVFKSTEIDKLIQAEDISKVIISIESLSITEKRYYISIFSKHNVSIEFLENIISSNSKLDYSLLLNRKIDWDNQNLNNLFRDKNILVTGAGGSIGSQLCMQLAEYNINTLFLVDFSEYNLFKIVERLKKFQNELNISFRLMNILDHKSLDSLFQNNKIEYIFHAAAYKHVSLLNSNILEAAKNNIISTLNLRDVCKKYKIDNLVYVSTDKAVRPSNFMGFTKRISEIIIQSAIYNNKHTNFSIVRFGNVLGSNGSVVQTFEEQVLRGGPVTVTHPNVNRYFMTVNEAVGLMLQSSLFSLKDNVEVFVLDMGKPIFIKSLAEQIIKLMGKNIKSKKFPNGDISLKFIGLFPGEKLSEELLIGNNPIKTSHNDIFKANETFPEKKDFDILINKILDNINEVNLRGLQILRDEYKNIID